MRIRPGGPADLPAIAGLYNHCVQSSPCTFDVERFSIEARRPWLEQFEAAGRHL